MKKLLLATILILFPLMPAQAMDIDSASISDTSSQSSDDSSENITQERLDELIESNKKNSNFSLALHLQGLRDLYFPQTEAEPSTQIETQPAQEEQHFLTDLVKKKSPFYISFLLKQGRVIMPSLQVIDSLLREACTDNNHDLVEFLMLEAGGHNTQYAQELVKDRIKKKDFVNVHMLINTYNIPVDTLFLAYFTKKMTHRDERNRREELLEAYNFIQQTGFHVDSKTATSYYVLAVKNYHEKLVDYFLEHGASKLSTEEHTGNNALHALIQKGYPSCTLLTTVFVPELLFQKNSRGKLPMDYFNPHPDDDQEFTRLLVDMSYDVLKKYMHRANKRMSHPTLEEKIVAIKQRLTSDRFVGTFDPLSASLNKKISTLIAQHNHDHQS